MTALFFALTGCSKLDLSGGNNSGTSDKAPSVEHDSSLLTVKTSLSASDAFRPQGATNPKTEKILKQIEEAEKQFGITVQVELVAEDSISSDFVSQTRAGKKFADLIQTDAQFFTRHYETGNILPLSQVGLTPSESGALSTVDGVTFAFRPDGWMNPLPTASFLLFYNEKIFLDGQLETPLTLYEDGYWNWENFLRTCKDVGNYSPGEIFTFAYPTQAEPDLMWATLHAHGARYFDKDGVCVMDSAEARAGFKSLKELISANHIYKLGSYINPTADPTAKLAFTNRHTTFYVGNSAELFDSSESSLTENLGEDLRIIGFPVASSQATGVSFTDDDVFLGIPSTANTELCKTVLPVLFAPAEGEDPKENVIQTYFFHEEDGELYFELLKQADTHTLLWADEHTATVEELFFGITNGRSEKEVLLNLQTMFNEGKG